MALKIRVAALQDSAGIARLCTQLGYPVADEVMYSRLELLLGSSLHAVMVVHQDEAVCGWISGEVRVNLESGTRAEITGLVVDSATRREGVGRILVAELERWARHRQCHEIVVRSSVSRPESHPFYENLGYGRAKTQHVYRKALDSDAL
jgi:GNAT superfamily N-acetyltransferase